MKNWQIVLVLVTITCVDAGLSLARGSRQREQQTGQPGVFDFYLLTLSWSPEFCHSHAYSSECRNGHYGFIVHGLWPQFTHGYPENCSNAPGPSNPSKMLDIMPDARLVQHEWATHGTCSGLTAEEYFKLIRKANALVRIPSRFLGPSEEFSIAPDEFKRQFLKANSRLNSDNIAVSCGNNHLTGVYICLTKSLEPTSCSDVRDCRANVIRVSPVR